MILKLLTLPFILLASTARAAESELLADTPSARAAGFEIVDMSRRPSDEYSDLVRTLVADYARSHGVYRAASADWAPIRLPGGRVLLAIFPLGAEFDGSGGGGRLIVYAVRSDTAAELALETSAMAVGIGRGGEIAAVDEHGFRVFRVQEKP